MSALPYPARSGLWAFDLIKLIHSSEAVLDIGLSGVVLVSHIAIAEHKLNYAAPPAYWQRELKRAVSMTDDEAFAAMRLRCVKAGWLVYHKGSGPRAIAHFWAEIPESLALLPRSNRGKAPVKTKDKTPAKAPVKTHAKTPGKAPTKAPVKTPVLSSPSPNSLSQGEGGPSRDTPPQEQDTTHLTEVLTAQGLSTTATALREWIDLLRGEVVQAQTPAEQVAALRWTLALARRRGTPVQYARHVAFLAVGWRESLAKPTRSKAAPLPPPEDRAAANARRLAGNLNALERSQIAAGRAHVAADGTLAKGPGPEPEVAL